MQKNVKMHSVLTYIKIKNNSVFGKQMENVGNRVNIVLIKHKIKDDESYSGLDKYLKLC